MQHKTSLFMAIIMAVGTAPVMVLAAVGDDHGEAGGKSLGLPQFDVATYPSQLFWMFVTFTFCYVIFAKKILPEISNIIKNRRERLEGDLQTAKDLRAEIDQVKADYEASIAQARADASAHIAKTQDSLRNNADNAARNFSEKMVTEIADFEKRTVTLKQNALNDISASVAAAACDIALKVSDLTIDQQEATSKVDEKLGVAKAA